MTGRDRTAVRFGFDSRGVSEVIGSILVFGLVMMLVAVFQIQAIPDANADVEFEHSQEVRGDFSRLQTAIAGAVDTGETREASVRLGVSYPPRLLFLNPPDTAGTLQTTRKGTVRLENVRSETDAGTFLDTNGGDHRYSTRALVYAIDYNELRGSPAQVREPAVTYRREDGAALVSDTTLVDGREITLVAIGGRLDASGVTAETVEAKPLSASARTYTVRGESASNPLTVTIPTKLSESKWRELLADETVSNGGHVQSISWSSGDPYNALTVTFEPGERYTLTMAKVGFGRGGDPRPAYVVRANPPSGGAVVEVRDRFNNPVSGVTLTASVSSGRITNGRTTGSRIQVTTGPNGRASVEVASGSPRSVTFEKDFDGSGSVTEPLERTRAYFGGGIYLTDALGSDGAQEVTIEVRNAGPSREIRSVQLNHVTEYHGKRVLDGCNLVATTLTCTEEGATNVTDGPDEVTGLSVDGASASVGTAVENGPPVTASSGPTVSGGTHDLTFALDGSYRLGPTDALAMRVTVYFEDGHEETYDVLLHGTDDAS